MQTRRKGQYTLYNAELTLSPRLCVKPLITAITAIPRKHKLVYRKELFTAKKL